MAESSQVIFIVQAIISNFDFIVILSLVHMIDKLVKARKSKSFYL